MAIDKSSGIPIYSRASMSSEEQDKQVLFSGIMTAVQNLMKDMDIGILNKITTEAYSIYGKEKGKFYLFFYGEIKKENVVDEILDYIGNFLDYIPLVENTAEFPDDVVNYLDGVIDQLFAIYSREDFQVEVYSYQKSAGLKSLYGEKDDLMRIHLVNLIKSTIHEEKEKSMIMLDFLPNGKSVIVQIFYDKETYNYLLVTIKSESIATVDFISYRHKLEYLISQFILTNKKDIFENLMEELEKELLFENFAKQIESMLGTLPPKLDLMGMDVLLNLMRKNLSSLITAAVHSKAIFVTGDRDVAEQVIALLSYLTHITDASLELSDEIPHRFQYIEPSFEGMINKLSAQKYDVDLNKFKYRERSQTIKKIVEDAFELGDTEKTLNYIRKMMGTFWNDIDNVQKQISSGVEILQELRSLPADRPKLMMAIIKRVNPYERNNIKFLSVCEGGINW